MITSRKLINITSRLRRHQVMTKRLSKMKILFTKDSLIVQDDINNFIYFPKHMITYSLYVRNNPVLVYYLCFILRDSN